MNHQHFEEWIFSDETLLPEQQLELDQHLHNCSDCRLLYASWHSAEALLQDPVMISPDANFALRWHAKAESEAKRRRRLVNGLWSFIILLAGIVLALASLGVFAWSYGGPANALIQITDSVTRLWTFLIASVRVSSIVVQQFPAITLLLAWGLLGAVSILFLIWLASYFQITRTRLA